jgi:small subunit ribosomal protein S3Ae
VRKVKLLKQPKFDLGGLLALHGESSADDSGQKVKANPTKISRI